MKQVGNATATLASDHLPILITINSELSKIDGPLRTNIYIAKADWALYTEALDECLAEAGETRTVEQSEKNFRKAVNSNQPNLPASAESLAVERERKRGLNLADETLNDLNKQIKKLVVEDKRTKWQSSTNATIEQAYRIYDGLLRA